MAEENRERPKKVRKLFLISSAETSQHISRTTQWRWKHWKQHTNEENMQNPIQCYDNVEPNNILQQSHPSSDQSSCEIDEVMSEYDETGM